MADGGGRGMWEISHDAAIRVLARDPLHHVVLLKHLSAFPDRTQAYQVGGHAGTATLVLCNPGASDYDRRAYPAAAWVVFIASDHPDLTTQLLDCLPAEADVVFKLATEADRVAVARRFTLTRRARFLSYTSHRSFVPDAAVRVTQEVDDTALRMFEAQGHSRAWLLALLASGHAVACVIDVDGRPGAVCFAFENYPPVWEVGGVFTWPALRGRGLAAKVVRTALAVLQQRELMSRYQVSDDNLASIRLAERLGLSGFLTLTHYLHTAAGT